jgi:DNA polymerase-3 subunit delta'
VKIFENIVGQPQVVRILEKAIQASRKSEDDNQEMTHSWIFTGPPGSGNSVAAKAFAAALVCPNDGCGECIDCKTAIDGSHLDIEIFKTEGLSIKIDEVRELISRTSTSPSIRGWRVVLIQDIQRLTEASANALLKAIEEPSMRTIWILTTTSIIEILPTIRSRCRVIQFRTPTRESLINYLIKKHKVDLALAENAARVSQGNIERAELIVINPQLLMGREEAIKIALASQDVPSAFKAAENFIELASKEVQEIYHDENEYYVNELQIAVQGINQGMNSRGMKMIKDLDNIQKNQMKLETRQMMEIYLLDIASVYRDALISRVGVLSLNSNINLSAQNQKIFLNTSTSEIVTLLAKIIEASSKISQGSAPKITLEKLFCEMVPK